MEFALGRAGSSWESSQHSTAPRVGSFNGHAVPANVLFVRMSRGMTGITDLNTPKDIVTESAIKKYMKTLRDLWSI